MTITQRVYIPCADPGDVFCNEPFPEWKVKC